MHHKKTPDRVWQLDAIRGIAIIAVVLAHMAVYIYESPWIWFHVPVNVPLLVLLTGVTSSISFQKQPILYSSIWKKILYIVSVYSIATTIYYIYDFGFSIDISKFMTRLINFTGAAHFYFVGLYIQLLLIAPFFFMLIHKKKIIQQLLALCGIYVLSLVFSTWSKGIDLRYGGSAYFGGTYMFLGFLGMFFWEFLTQKNTKRWYKILAICSGIGLYIFETKKLYINMGGVPPDSRLMIFTTLVFLFFFSLFSLSKDKAKMFLLPLMFLGKNSLIIYFYHWIFFYGILKYADDPINLPFVNRVILVCAAFLGPIFLHFVTQKIKRLVQTYTLQYTKSL